ncbi:MAG: sphingomyelin synthase family protein [Nanoarchaeota archaeon]|nr:sphingomyelin synthase family protein [Nanoarchaeota archaeon]
MKKREFKRYYNLWIEEILTGKRFKAWTREISNNKKALLISLVFLVIAVILNGISGRYVTRVGVGVPTDIILNHVGPYNLQIFFGWGYLIFMALLFFFPLFFRIKSLHHVIGQWSLLVMMRSFFISLTHLRTPLTAIPSKFPQIFQPFVFENDLFFSGHTATTFLGFLLFKESKIRWVFLAGSIFLGSVTLLMHRHYSIDVFAAYFITYGTYQIGKWIFNKK